MYTVYWLLLHGSDVTSGSVRRRAVSVLRPTVTNCSTTNRPAVSVTVVVIIVVIVIFVGCIRAVCCCRRRRRQSFRTLFVLALSTCQVQRLREADDQQAEYEVDHLSVEAINVGVVPVTQHLPHCRQKRLFYRLSHTRRTLLTYDSVVTSDIITQAYVVALGALVAVW